MTDRTINDGGPAFPMQDPQAIHAKAAAAIFDIPAHQVEERDRVYTKARADAVGGMSLRDKFAEAALISGEAGNWRDNQYTPVDGLNIIENTARHAYLIADAMLKARGGAQ